jgi:hypothetical protein
VDIEFHYYMTYLIAARAGYSPADATIIAHAAQSVDDNHIPVAVGDAAGTVYENALSQTMDITRPHDDALIYPIFHFIPGDPEAPSARRVDGVQHPMNTTPNSALANKMIDAALASGDLYRIGVSAHGYVDTWAHQNFVGQRDDFNEFSTGIFQRIAEKFFAVGHAHAKHNPDLPALVWEDSRLVNRTVDNRIRFLDAAEHLFRKLAAQKKPALKAGPLDAEIASLRIDLDADIGCRDDRNENKDIRIASYGKRAATAPYGGRPMPEYVTGLWFGQAIEQDRNAVIESFKDRFSIPYDDLGVFVGDVIANGHRATVAWKDRTPGACKTYHWYKFQEAVKCHLAECTAMLNARRHDAKTKAASLAR